MKMIFEYGKQKFTADLSDSRKNAKLALNLAWDLIDDKTKLIFMSDFSDKNKPTAIFNYPKENII